jgi:hypothetical protein
MKGYMKAHGMVISSPPPIRWWQFLRRFRAWWNRPRVRKEFRKFQFPSSKPDPMNEVPFTVGPATPTPMQRPASRLLFMDFKYPEKTDE